MNFEEQKMLDDYIDEINGNKKYSKEEIERLIKDLETNGYDPLRELMKSQLLHAYEISSKYHHEEISPLDFVHAANEGLEMAVTSKNYKDYASFMTCVENGVKESIELMLSFLNN